MNYVGQFSEPDPLHPDLQIDGVWSRYEAIQELIFGDTIYNRSIQPRIPRGRVEKRKPFTRKNSSRKPTPIKIPATKQGWTRDIERRVLAIVQDSEEPMLLDEVATVPRDEMVAEKVKRQGVIGYLFSGYNPSFLGSALGWWATHGVIDRKYYGMKLLYSPVFPDQKTFAVTDYCIEFPGLPSERYCTVLEVIEPMFPGDSIRLLVQGDDGCRWWSSSDLLYRIQPEVIDDLKRFNSAE